MGHTCKQFSQLVTEMMMHQKLHLQSLCSISLALPIGGMLLSTRRMSLTDRLHKSAKSLDGCPQFLVKNGSLDNSSLPP